MKGGGEEAVAKAQLDKQTQVSKHKQLTSKLISADN